MVVVMSAGALAAECLRKILEIRQLARLGRSRKIARQLAELAGRACISLRLRGSGGSLQVARDLLRHRSVLGRVGLLKLLQRGGQLSESRKLAAVGLCRRCGGRARVRGNACALQGAG